MISLSKRRLLGFLLVLLAIFVAAAGLLLAFAVANNNAGGQLASLPPLSTLAFTPTTRLSPAPVLTVTGNPPQVAARAAYLLDADTGKTLDDWHGELPLSMASTTKIMTALLAIQNGHLDQFVTVHQDAYDEVRLNDNASSANLRPGERVKLGELLYGLMLPSGNDAAVAIADAVGGSVSNFVNMMNVEAYRLQLFQTHFTSPDGLIYSPDHYTTAYDLARLARYAMRLSLFATIVSTPVYSLPRTITHPAYLWSNTNELLAANSQNSYSGATGIKTGHTEQAGECLVFSATRGNHHLIGVFLYSTQDTSDQRFRDARTLLDWGLACL